VNPRPSIVHAVLSLAAAGAVLPGGAAAAAPAFPEDGELGQSLSIIMSGTECYSSNYGHDPEIDHVPVVENGAVTQATNTGFADMSDNVTPMGRASVTQTTRAALTSVGGVPHTIDYAISGKGQMPTSPGWDCSSQLYAGTRMDFTFHVPVSGYLTFTTSYDGLSTGRVSISSEPGTLGGNNDGGATSVTGSGTSRMFLLPGDYHGTIEGSSGVSTPRPAATGAFSAHGTFTPAGSQTVAVAGKGQKYVVLPASASCGTGQVAASVTPKKKRAGKVRDLVFFIGETKVKKVGHPKKGQVVTLPASAAVPTELRVEVTLEPKAKGKKPKVLETTASYEACS